MTTSFTAAAFDFDHTMTDRDSLLAFLFYSTSIWKTCYHLAVLGPSFISFLSDRLSRQNMKEKILTRFLGGLSFEEVQILGQKFANSHLDHYLKPKALQRLHWHQAQGHRCVLVSAGLEFYLAPWAERHGFEAVIASQLELTPAGKITGRLAGLNCWGPEKKRRLLAYLGPKKNYGLYVYGDSRGDQELLELSDHPFYRTF